MAYRDDLEAAHARIEALEAQLAATGLQTTDAQVLLARANDLEKQIADMQTRVRDITSEHDRLVEALRFAAPHTMPTLTEHNRGVAPGKHALSGEPGGVRCPMCDAIGDPVEMRFGGNLQLVVDIDGAFTVRNTVRCPRCSYLALKSV